MGVVGGRKNKGMIGLSVTSDQLLRSKGMGAVPESSLSCSILKAPCAESGGGEKSQASFSLAQPTTHHIREPMRSQLSAMNGPVGLL